MVSSKRSLFEMSLVSNVPGQISYINHPNNNEEEEDEFFDAQSEMDPEDIIRPRRESQNYNQQTITPKRRVNFADNLVTDVWGPKKGKQSKALSCEAYRIFSKSISVSISTKMIRKVRIAKRKVEFLRKRRINSMYY